MYFEKEVMYLRAKGESVIVEFVHVREAEGDVA